MKVKFVSYDGKWPCLCSGTLVVDVNGQRVAIDDIRSGGRVWFDADWGEHVERGTWNIGDFPAVPGVEWTAELKAKVVAVLNYNVEQGCCGGCV